MEVSKQYGSFPSADGVHRIHYFCIAPKEPRAILQVEHGIAEHIERYVNFATCLAEQGYAVFADDHLGHGRSIREPEELCWFSEKDGWRLVCEDVWQLHDEAVKRWPGIPYILMGHSMGSFLARTVAVEHSHEMDGLILSGTGHQSGGIIAAGRVICAIEKKRLGSKGRSKLVNAVAFGPYNKAFAPNRTNFDWLTRDTAEVDRYIANPLCGAETTAGLFDDMLCGLDIIRRPENIQRMRKDLPVYMLSGDKDPVGDMGKGVQIVHNLLVQAGLNNVILRLYPEGRHELLNGPDRVQVTDDLLEWLAKI